MFKIHEAIWKVMVRKVGGQNWSRYWPFRILEDKKLRGLASKCCNNPSPHSSEQEVNNLTGVYSTFCFMTGECA